MLQRSTPPTSRRPGAVAIHEASLQLAAAELNLPIRPPELERGVRLSLGDVFLGSSTDPHVLEVMGFVFLAGAATLRRCGDDPGNSRDDLEGRGLIFDSVKARWGPMAIHHPSPRREAEARCSELAAEAERFVDEIWDRILQHASDLEAG
jgi:hypothetical protein